MTLNVIDVFENNLNRADTEYKQRTVLLLFKPTVYT